MKSKRVTWARMSVVLGLSIGAAVMVPDAHPATAESSGSTGDPVLAWNANAGEAAIAACLAPTDNPLHESRMYAMMHVAVHDAVNAIERRSQPYAYHGAVVPGASVDAAVAAAAHDVLVPLLLAIPAPFPPACGQAGAASVEADYAAALAAIPDGAAKSQGLALGRDAAAAILSLRADDGSDTPLIVEDIPQGTEPGEYRFTPGTPFQFAPGWSDVTPFVLRTSSQFRAAKPYKVTSKRYATDYEEVKQLGGDGVNTPSARTADETEIALFWLESSPLQWNRIARTVSNDAGLDAWENARLFGLLNLAMADGYISSFETKNHYNFWRPVTAIREGDNDGNRRTDGDATWTPLVTTPPIPDHDSAHSVEGGAAAQVLMRFFGTDIIGFETCSLTLPAGQTCADTAPVRRSYTSFTEAADENGVSRILIGFHFRRAVDQGIEHGRRIADRTVNRFLRPVC